MHDLEIVAAVELVGGQNAVLSVDFEDGDRNHEIKGQAISMRLSEGKIMRHLRGSILGAGQFPLDGSPKGTASGAITAEAIDKAAAAC
jgi:hypothetical protein